VNALFRLLAGGRRAARAAVPLAALLALAPPPSAGIQGRGPAEPATATAIPDARGDAWIDVDRLRERIHPHLEDGTPVWEYELAISDQELRLADGTRYKVWAFGGTVPGPTILAREGDRVRIRLVNETSVGHTLHSHGLYVPRRMDGVVHGTTHAAGEPMGDQPVEPGETATYEYIARPAGTHFYHCHVNTNEHLDRGMSGALIVLPRRPDPPVDRDVALILDEWDSSYAQSGVPGDPRRLGGYDFFTLNGRSFPETTPLALRLGDVARVRLINAGALPHYMHLHGHSFLVTHRDGSPLPEPIVMDTVDVGPGQRVDLLIAADNPGLWPFHCHTAAHVTNAGVYPGGMLTHILVGPDPYPRSGDGPLGPSLEEVRRRWLAARAQEER
jgi:FtsP/CotA-like multicopper oxidase with cupredoxin domain